MQKKRGTFDGCTQDGRRGEERGGRERGEEGGRLAITVAWSGWRMMGGLCAGSMEIQIPPQPLQGSDFRSIVEPRSLANEAGRSRGRDERVFE